MVFMVLVCVLFLFTTRVDQIATVWCMMTRLPSVEILSCVTLGLGSVIGSSLLATHTVVKTGILSNHMPRYQSGFEEVVSMDSLRVVLLGGRNWKKPSANLPFAETSLSPTVSTWPAARVSPLAEEHGVVACKRRRRPINMWRGTMSMEKKSYVDERNGGKRKMWPSG